MIHIFLINYSKTKSPPDSYFINTFSIHQPNQKPEWGVVKADDSFIICFGFTIIPRAAAAFFQEGAGAVFGEENTGGVDGAAHEDMPALHFFTERRKNGRHAINGEHPDGRLAGHFFVFSPHKEPHPVHKHSIPQPMRPHFRKSVVCFFNFLFKIIPPRSSMPRNACEYSWNSV